MRTAESAGAPARRRPRVTLDQLHAFVALAEHGSLTRTARLLHRSPAALSAQVQGLERVLGMPLFHRAARGMRLSDAGRTLGHGAAWVLDRVAALEDEAATMRRAQTGEVVIAAGAVIGTHRLPAWLGPLLGAGSGLDVRVVTEGRDAALRRLLDHGADIAVVGDRVEVEGLETGVVERTELIAVVSSRHPLASRLRLPADLVVHRFLARSPASATERLSARLLGDLYRAGPHVELGEGALVRALTDGVGWACVPRSAVDAALQAGALVELTLPRGAVAQEITAARRSETATPAADRVWRHLIGPSGDARRTV
jgi:DNA-binding transcriptional LysR family regulator